MRHPLGGDWMSFSDMKSHHGWMLPFVIISLGIFLIIYFVIGLLIMFAVIPFSLYYRIADWYQEKKTKS